MNTNDHNPHDERRQDEISDALRWQLRALRRDEPPSHDLWPGIAERLQATPQSAPRPTPRRWIAPVAMAASLLLVVSAIGWLRTADQSTAPAADSLVQREAEGMTRQYQAALLEMEQAAPESTPVLQPAFRELDRNASLILDALAHDPDSRLLLEQLRRTYARRIALTQRAALT